MDQPSNLSIDYLNLLPDEILIEILLNTDDLETLSRWCLTSKRINNICQDEFFWKRKYKKDFGFRSHGSWGLSGLSGLSGETTLVEGYSWKELYKRASLIGINSPISAGRNGYGIIDQKGNLYMSGGTELLGIGQRIGRIPKGPHLLKFPSKVVSISVGTFFAGAVTADGKAYLWGHNTKNIFRLEDDIETIYSPREIILPTKVKAIKIKVSGVGYIILLKDNSVYLSIFCEHILSGESTEFFRGIFRVDAIDVSIGMDRYAIIAKDHKLYISEEFCELDNLDKLIHIEFPGLARQVIVGEHTMILSVTGDVYKWHIRGRSLKLIELPEPIVQLSEGGGTSAALSETGKLYMWGSNSWNKITTNFKEYVIVGLEETGWYPVRISFGTPINFISVGGSFTIAVGNDGMVNYWGVPRLSPL